MPEKTKAERIKAENRRLKKIYADIDEKRKNTVAGLIDRLSFLRVELEELEENIKENGMTELFSQGEQEPYSRKRPEADLYNTMGTAYQKGIKLLTDMLPRPEAAAKREKESDPFGDFVNGRDDV